MRRTTRQSVSARTLRACTLSVLATLLLTATAIAQPGKKKVERLTWELNQSYSDVQITADAKTMTTRLPPVNSITNSFPGQFGKIKLHYSSSGTGLPESRFIQAAALYPHGSKFTCGNNSVVLTCRADSNWLRTMTETTTVQIEVGGAGVSNSKPKITWIFEPPPNEVFIDRITGPGAVTLGALAEFTIRLDQPAPSGGLEVMWMIDPGSCFTPLKGNVDYSVGSLNRLSIAAGQQYRSFALGTSAGCKYTSATLRTWVHERVDRTPYYRTLRFSLSKPRRR